VSSKLPNDGRPCATDTFLNEALKIDDHYDLREALKAWNEGDWDEALSFFNEAQIASLKEPIDASE
jgi:hypothetical protein